MKKYFLVALLILALVFCAACSTSQDQPTDEEQTEQVTLTVAAAASLTNVTEEIKDLYAEKAPNVTLNFTYGSSGALQTQIEEGAGVDVFFSAATKQMNALTDEDLIDTASRKDLLANEVVLIIPKDSTKDITSFEDLATDKVSLLAIGDPASVPAGQYAKEVFTALGIWDAISAKATLGTDVTAVLTWVENGEVDCGVVYSTDAASSDKVTVVCDAPADSHSPIIYPVAIVKASANAEAAADFIDFLSSDEAMQVFAEYGFKANK